MIENRFIFIFLLLSNFNNKIISMESNCFTNDNLKSSQDKLTLSNVPEEIRCHIIDQLVDINKLNDILKKIRCSNNIFDLYFLNLTQFKKELIENLKTLRLTSHQLKNSAQYCINKLNHLKDIFKKKEQEFITEIKKEYFNYSENQLNNELINILDPTFIIIRNDLERAVRLIIAGANINLQGQNFTTLMIAAFKGYKDIVKFLLKNKDIDVNLKNKYDCYNALMFASFKGHKNIVKLLLKNKDIDVNAKDRLGQTALIWAIKENHQDIVELLLKHKDININLEDNKGYNVLMIAKKLGLKKLIKLIQAKN